MKHNRLRFALLPLFSGLLAWNSSVDALTISTITSDANTFEVDVFWGEQPPSQPELSLFYDSTVLGTVARYAASDTPVGSHFPNLDGHIIFNVLRFSDSLVLTRLDFLIGSSRSFAPPTISGPWTPTLLESSDGGFGAHIIYGVNPHPASALPEGGTTAAMLGLTAAGLAVSVRNRR